MSGIKRGILRGGLFAMAVCAAMTEQAGAYTAINLFQVRRIDAQHFEVLPRGGLTNVDGWCAAGDYVMHLLSLPPATPIWRISEPPRKARQSVVFSLNEDGAARSNGLYQIGGGTLYLTAAAAQAFCPESIAYWMW